MWVAGKGVGRNGRRQAILAGGAGGGPRHEHHRVEDEEADHPETEEGRRRCHHHDKCLLESNVRELPGKILALPRRPRGQQQAHGGKCPERENFTQQVGSAILAPDPATVEEVRRNGRGCSRDDSRGVSRPTCDIVAEAQDRLAEKNIHHRNKRVPNGLAP